MIRQKSSRVLLAAILLVMISVQSYDITGVGSDSQSEVKFDVPPGYRLIGKLHNQGLDHIYNVIKTKSMELLGKEGENLNLDYHAIVREEVSKFCSTNKYLKRGQKTLQKVLPSYRAKSNKSSFKLAKLKNISSEQKGLLNEIKKYFTMNMVVIICWR